MDNKLREIEEALSKATPGPWYWHGFIKGKDVDLCTKRNGQQTVMGFQRWGMGGAGPVFRTEDGMKRIDEPGMVTHRQEHRANEFYNINHPDANLIANAPEWLRYQQSVIDTYVKTLTVKDDSIKTLEDTIKRLTEERDELLRMVKTKSQQMLDAENESSSLLRQKEEENKPLLEFAQKVLRYGFEGDLCGGDIQDLGVKHGLLVEEKYDPDKHGEDFGEDFETGDTIYMFSDVLKAKAQ